MNIYVSDKKVKIRGREQRKANRERLREIGDAVVAYLEAAKHSRPRILDRERHSSKRTTGLPALPQFAYRLEHSLKIKRYGKFSNIGTFQDIGQARRTTKLDFAETGYTAFGLTYEDTCKMSQEDPETTEFYAEEEDDPVETIEKQGKITFTFSIMNPELETLKRLFGGEVATNVWSYPDVVNSVEESVITFRAKG